jgi:hypothetical protein
MPRLLVFRNAKKLRSGAGDARKQGLEVASGSPVSGST